MQLGALQWLIIEEHRVIVQCWLSKEQEDRFKQKVDLTQLNSYCFPVQAGKQRHMCPGIYSVTDW